MENGIHCHLSAADLPEWPLEGRMMCQLKGSPLTEPQTARQKDGDRQGCKTDSDGWICSYPDCSHSFNEINFGSNQFNGCFI